MNNKNINDRLINAEVTEKDFVVIGYLPIKEIENFKGTEKILSDENISLKKKIKKLQKEIESLRSENEKLVEKIYRGGVHCDEDNT